MNNETINHLATLGDRTAGAGAVIGQAPALPVVLIEI